MACIVSCPSWNSQKIRWGITIPERQYTIWPFTKPSDIVLFGYTRYSRLFQELTRNSASIVLQIYLKGYIYKDRKQDYVSLCTRRNSLRAHLPGLPAYKLETKPTKSILYQTPPIPFLHSILMTLFPSSTGSTRACKKYFPHSPCSIELDYLFFPLPPFGMCLSRQQSSHLSHLSQVTI